MKSLTLKEGLSVLFVVLLLGTTGVTVYNNISLKKAVDEAKYDWVKMGGVVSADGHYFVLED